MRERKPSIAVVVAPSGGMAHYVLHLWEPLSRHAHLRWVAAPTERVMDGITRRGIVVSADLDPGDPASARRAATAWRRAGIQIVNLQVATRLVTQLEFHLRLVEECRRHGVRVVHTLHNALPHSVSGYDPERLRALYDLADGYVVGNPPEEERLRAWFAPGARPVVSAAIGPFTLLDSRRHDRASARLELRLPEDAPVVLFFGSYRSEKGLEVLLEAFPRVQALRPDAWLVVSTSPRHCPEKASFLADLRDASAARPGWRVDDAYAPDEQVEVLFRAADIVVLPYRRVTQSGVRALAAAFARAVVLTDAFADGAALDGVWGRCVPPGDADALSAGIVDLLARPRAERDALGRAGSERAQRLESWKENAANVAALCRRILDC